MCYYWHYCKLLSTIDRIIYFGGGPSELNRRLRLKENTIHCTVQYSSKLTYCMRVCAPAPALLSRSTTVSIRYDDKNGGRTALSSPLWRTGRRAVAWELVVAVAVLTSGHLTIQSFPIVVKSPYLIYSRVLAFLARLIPEDMGLVLLSNVPLHVLLNYRLYVPSPARHHHHHHHY